MYQYIYDAALNNKKFRLLTTAIENRLTDLGIQGRIDKLSLFKNVRETVEEGIRRGVTTVVAVGGDETIKKVMEIIPQFPLVFGMIPVGKNIKIPHLFGVPDGLAACDVLSARLVQTLDIGRANGQHFLAAMSIPDGHVTLECDGKFKVAAAAHTPVHICNMTPLLDDFAKEGAQLPHLANPSDGMLEAVIAPRRSVWGARGKKTVFNLRRMTVSSPQPFVYYLDGRRMKGERAEVDVLPGKLRIIVGKRRLFRDG